MTNILTKSLALILLVTVTVIECQVTLNRNQLATWLPSYSNEITLSLESRNIFLIDINTFSGLSNLKNLYLFYNLLTNIDSATFSGLSNLQYLNLHYNLLH